MKEVGSLVNHRQSSFTSSEKSDFSSLPPPVFPADSFEEARLKGALGAAVETAVEALPALMLLDMRL